VKTGTPNPVRQKGNASTPGSNGAMENDFLASPRLRDFALKTGRNLVHLDFPAKFKVIQSVSKRFKPKER
jgi:hypothetical protein